MFRIDTPHSTVVLPAPAVAGVAGYFQETNPAGSTEFSADWCNHVQEAISRTIEAANLALDKTAAGFDQMATVTTGGATIRPPTAALGFVDTGIVTTLLRRAVMSSNGSRSSGADSVCAASQASHASGARSLVAASDFVVASGAESAVIASGAAALASTASGVCSLVAASIQSTASGPESAVIACDGTVAPCVASALTSAVIASRNGAQGNGALSLVAACDGCTTNVAKTGEAVIASIASSVNSPRGGILSSDTCTATGAARAVCVGSLSCGSSGTGSGCYSSVSTIASGLESGTYSAATIDVSGDFSAAVAIIGAAVKSVAGAGSAAIAGIGILSIGGNNSALLAVNGAACAGHRSAILASQASGVYTFNANVCTECAIIGCQSSAISGSAAGAFPTNAAVLLGSLNAELADSVATSRDYSVAGGYSAVALVPNGAAQNLTWRIASNGGNIYLAGALFAGGAGGGPDFAEMFENAEMGTIPPGSIVTRRGRRVTAARPGDRIFGVVSAAPAVLAGDSVDAWAKRWQSDEWGRTIHAKDDNGLLSPVVSPDFDPARPYLSRMARPEEWTPVALVGQVRVRVDATEQPDSFVLPGQDGVGTHGEEPRGRPVECMEIVLPYSQERGYGVALCMVG